MTVVAAAVCPATPLLFPDVAVSGHQLDRVQSASRLAVAGLLPASPDEVVVLGAVAAATGPVELTGTWDWSGFGLPPRVAPSERLPRSLAVGARLLDDAGWSGSRRYLAVPSAAPRADCSSAGDQLRQGEPRTALLVVADGSARRSDKAPGFLDARAEPFDAAVATALDAVDVEALRRLDPELATQLLAEGRAPLQVLAAAAAGDTWAGRLLLDEAPYGVGWFVASWQHVDETF